MSAKIIDGKAIAARIKENAAKDAAEVARAIGRKPCLAVVIVGEDPASRVYVNNKKKACEACGITSLEYALPEQTSQEELLALIDRLDRDDAVDGVLCQLPLPAHISEEKVIEAISPDKDVDGFHPVNVGKMVTGGEGFLPCTPAGLIEMLKYEGIETAGKRCVVIGRSNIVGKPAALLMLRENATVTVCHSRTNGLKEIVREADIVIAAVGRPKFVTADMLKPGAVVLDVGINRLPDRTLCGDVDFAAASETVSAITPVPGGVGPMTVAMLMKNTVEAARRRARASL
ncbi:MAG: bifunctional methylenetetrahydrofolate dehydrogenase/methenyltetrahydrofolate cyclohydrolase FolD [Clostridia bacterium]|nr:bifunctional methylenetetrahydrofolate dehydrogenase/methenyltetrahydrofolate cyclohydrolase FolD [Clostridia bacterium]